MVDFSVLAASGFNIGPFVLLGMVLVAAAGLVVSSRLAAKKPAPVEEVAQAPVAPPQSDTPVAPGSAGTLKLHNVPPKTAAMLMAIVAEKTGKPLNELRFRSIKEVK